MKNHYSRDHPTTTLADPDKASAQELTQEYARAEIAKVLKRKSSSLFHARNNKFLSRCISADIIVLNGKYLDSLI